MTASTITETTAAGYDPELVDAWINPLHISETNLDAITGFVCPSCRLIWVGGYTPEELGEDNIGDSTSDSAEAFIQSISALFVSKEPDHGHGYCDCLVCDTVLVDGHNATAYTKP